MTTREAFKYKSDETIDGLLDDLRSSKEQIRALQRDRDDLQSEVDRLKDAVLVLTDSVGDMHRELLSKIHHETMSRMEEDLELQKRMHDNYMVLHRNIQSEARVKTPPTGSIQ